jgi:pimeloyl-ACP methyl ester carboxylesterase
MKYFLMVFLCFVFIGCSSKEGDDMAFGKNMETNYFESIDGIKIAYYKLGSGPNIILVHGGVEVAKSHIELAGVLSNYFTVYMYDRRGRGESDKYDIGEYSIQKEVDDLTVLRKMTDTKYIFGISSGALIVLRTLIENSEIEKAIIYEPPLSINGSFELGWVDKFNTELSEGKIDDALITGMLGTQMGPAFFSRIPKWLLKLMLNSMNNKPDKYTGTTMSELAPTLVFDNKLVLEMVDTLDQYHAIETDILLLGGSDSPAYLKNAVEQLGTILPKVNRITLEKMGHGGSGNRNQGGHPDIVGQIMVDFIKNN